MPGRGSRVFTARSPRYRKWPELFPRLTQAVLDGAAETGAKLVFADNLYAYGPPDGPMTEMTPQRAQGRKGRTRIEMADALLRAHGDGTVRVTIGRSSDYYGPRGTGTTAGDNVMKPALRGKRARWLGSLDQPHKLNYLEESIMNSDSTGASPPFSTSEGEQIGINWDQAPFDVEQFRKGMDVELEHGLHDPATNVTDDEPDINGKIALAHLNEFPDYYTRLERMEEEAKREHTGR